MSLSKMIKSYTMNMRLKGKLKKSISLEGGKVFKKGTMSENLIKKSNGKYHFEADNHACVVEDSEIEIV